MATIYWDPFQGFNVIRRELERVFDTYDPNPRLLGRRLFPGAPAQTFPLINTAEDKDNVYIEAIAPGLDPASIEVSVLRDQLRIAGTKAAINPDIKPEAFHRSERTAGGFARTMTLPTEIDGDKVKAEYKHGILMLTLPKHEAAKPKAIAVSVA